MYLSDEDILWDEPLIAYVEGFMAPSDCDKIIEYATPMLEKSLVTSDEGNVTHYGRTSSEHFIRSGLCEPNDYHRGVVSEFFGVGEFKVFILDTLLNHKHAESHANLSAP